MDTSEPRSGRRIGALSVRAAAIAVAESLQGVLGLIADETCRAPGADEVAISRSADVVLRAARA